MTNGGIIGPVNATTVTSGSGIWRLEEQHLAAKTNTWPSLADQMFSRVQILVQNGTATNLGAGGALSNNGAAFSPTTNGLSGSTGTVQIGQSNKSFFLPHQSAYNDMSQGWCLEFYSYLVSAGSTGYVVGKWSSPWQFAINSYSTANNYTWAFRNTSSGDTINAVSGFSTNTWEHWAFVIDPSPATSWRVYKNGVQVQSGNHNGSLNLSNTTRIGFGYKEDSSTVWDGNAYLDRIRLTMKNRYTANFTPPTSALPTF